MLLMWKRVVIGSFLEKWQITQGKRND